MTTVSTQRLTAVFVEVADTLVDNFDTIEFLEMVTTRTAELVDASAVGLLLADHRGALQFMAASDEASRLLELFQLQNQEGPCLDAYRTGDPVINIDLQQATARWPLFAPRAAGSGFLSVHALPLRLRGQVIGALNLFGAGIGPMPPATVGVAQALADIATIGLMQQRAVQGSEQLAEQLQGALNSRIAIEQAKGALSRIHDISVDQAFVLLRSYARTNNRRLVELAQSVVSDPAGVPGLTRG